MRRKIRFAVFVLLFAYLMGTDYARFAPIQWGWLQQCRDEAVSACNSRDVQQAELICLTLYLVAFVVRLGHLRRVALPSRAATSLWNAENLRMACLVSFCGAALLSFFVGPASMLGSTDPVVLFWGLAVGKGLRLLKMGQKNRENARQVHEDILNALLVVLTFSVLLQADWLPQFQYHGRIRWQGPWWNPNTFGLLMAVGLVLVLGLAWHEFTVKPTSERGRRLNGGFFWLAFYVVALGLMVIGLVNSYSRGAWLGAAIGLAYLAWQFLRRQKEECRRQKGEDSAGESEFGNRKSEISTGSCHSRGSRGILWLRRNWMPLAVILASLAVLAFWSFRHMDAIIARRAFSVANVNDLSWRNRLVAYEGGLQMMATSPWCGFGWDQPKPVYEEFYMPTQLIDSRVFDLNDYFNTGLALGLPALACFLTYIWLSLHRHPASNIVHPECSSPATRHLSLRASCRAGLVILLVGFWLQQGLFWLALGVPFWALLELGDNTEDYSTRWFQQYGSAGSASTALPHVQNKA